MFCEQCGRANSQGSAFCEGCGAALEQTAVATNPSPTAPTSVVPPPPTYVSPIVDLSDSTTERDTPEPKGNRRSLKLAALAFAGVMVGVALGVTARDLGALDFMLGERFDTAQVEARESESRALGQTDGYEKGFAKGITEGVKEGELDGYAEGFAEGRKDGENRAYEGAGSSIQEVSWSYNIDSGNEGICVDFTGSYLLSNWKWVFEYPDGTVDTIEESSFSRSNSGWCYDTLTLSRYTDVSRLYDATLTIYVTRGSLTDRWGPLPSPFG